MEGGCPHPPFGRLRGEGTAPPSNLQTFENTPEEHRHAGPRCHPARMTKLCIFVGTTVGGYAGWALGEALGLGFGWAFVLSGVGSIVGVYAGWKLAQKLAE